MLEDNEIVVRIPGITVNAKGQLKREQSKTMKKVGSFRKRNKPETFTTGTTTSGGGNNGGGKGGDVATFFRTGRVLSTRGWHCVTMTQAASTTFIGVNGSTHVYVDGISVWSRNDIPYLSFGNKRSSGGRMSLLKGSESPSINTVGRKQSVDSGGCDSFHGCISSLRMFDMPLDR